MPASSSSRGEIIEAPSDWTFDPDSLDAAAETVVWGRMPEQVSSPSRAVRRAMAREATLRTMRRHVPFPLRLIAVHRLPPRQLEAGSVRSRVRAAVRGGALVELSSLGGQARVLDSVLAAAGLTRFDTRFHAGAGGAMVIHAILPDRSAAFLRLARAGTPGDPARSADVLEQLRGAGMAIIPRVEARGYEAGASWVLERALFGREPKQVTLRLARQLAEACAAFPRSETPPVATAEDVAGIAARLAERSGPLTRLAREVEGQVRTLPAVLRHGDLWAGNLLVHRGRLVGMVDWDAAHPAAIPGADLLQLVSTELRRRSHLELGPAFLNRPWRESLYSRTTQAYWPALGIRPDDGLLHLVAVAWWAAEIHGTLSRLPHRATDERWITTNVDQVLTALGY